MPHDEKKNTFGQKKFESNLVNFFEDKLFYCYIPSPFVLRSQAAISRFR
jgi:hypothetical protein